MDDDFTKQTTLPAHVAIIMDGNGRWAADKGWPRCSGHQAGAGAVRRTVEAARRLGIPVLTLYAFSADNWNRPAAEVVTLMRLFRLYLQDEADECVRNEVRLQIIGRRDRLDSELVSGIETVETATRHGRALHLRIAIDYSSRDAIVSAAALARGDTPLDREGFRRLLARVSHADQGTADVDLLIRTGREQRLSDFLLWELAYAELHFSEKMWPEFEAADLQSAVAWFASRQRRFGTLPIATGTENNADTEDLQCYTTSVS